MTPLSSCRNLHFLRLTPFESILIGVICLPITPWSLKTLLIGIETFPLFQVLISTLGDIYIHGDTSSNTFSALLSRLFSDGNFLDTAITENNSMLKFLNSSSYSDNNLFFFSHFVILTTPSLSSYSEPQSLTTVLFLYLF